MLESTQAIVNQAGWRPAAWCRLIGISRAKLYLLSPDQWPRHVRIGKCVIIRETPQDYLARMAEVQDAQQQAAAQ